MAERKPVKVESGVEFPAEAYAYVPDPEKPSTWKVRLWEDPEKKETPRQVGMAVAALGPGGFSRQSRGDPARGPAEGQSEGSGRLEESPPRCWRGGAAAGTPGKARTRDGVHAGTRASWRCSHLGATWSCGSIGERGVIQGVKILGPSSANRRTYLPEALRAAIKLYECGARQRRSHSYK